jgi:hypothetical protein
MMKTATKTVEPEATIENTRIGDLVETKSDRQLWTVTGLSSDPVTVYPISVSCHSFKNNAIMTMACSLDSLLNVSARIRAQEAASVLEA